MMPSSMVRFRLVTQVLLLMSCLFGRVSPVRRDTEDDFEENTVASALKYRAATGRMNDTALSDTLFFKNGDSEGGDGDTEFSDSVHHGGRRRPRPHPHCCSKCSGSKFCSPESGHCYPTKKSWYYLTCGGGHQGGGEFKFPHCCSHCTGFKYCSPKSNQCHPTKNSDYYLTCGGGNSNPGGSTHHGKEIWKDDFNGNGLPDHSKWHMEHRPYPPNNEKQAYIGREVRTANVSGGTLKIYARRESYKGRKYTSARMVSRQSWLYGRFSAKIRLSRCGARGSWPAFWMLPTDNKYGAWPRSGEIDIMEMVGYHNNLAHFTVHTQHRNAGSAVTSNASFDINQWHVFAAEWRRDGIKMFLDNRQVYHYENRGGGSPKWPFDKRFHFVLNVAVGGSWGGRHGIDDNKFHGQGQYMEVDWVKVEQL
eukprot:TRINITY_DN10763_c0_g7_i1.p1 TRINITY_DN10763_c0_g7~~TRINITY_DN10763_c0_g7_i1.p1  ORF type:complete len:421 (+),score=19.99 TRINITY_DN10763_c0_g7_i1:70-1332(+)